MVASVQRLRGRSEDGAVVPERRSRERKIAERENTRHGRGSQAIARDTVG
jgi:hypothetical protein